jgi:HEAT repeat protein
MLMGSEAKPALAPLRQALKDEDPVVRKAAKQTLQLLDPEKR